MFYLHMCSLILYFIEILLSNFQRVAAPIVVALNSGREHSGVVIVAYGPKDKLPAISDRAANNILSSSAQGFSSN